MNVHPDRIKAQKSVLEFIDYALEQTETFRSDIDSHKRLENEPKLFTRSEVVEYMKRAITMQGLQSKPLKYSELDGLLP